MPGWAVSIGLLDPSLNPIAGIVYAPKWGPDPAGGVLLFADIGEGVLVNEVEIPRLDEDFDGNPQVFAGSSVHKRYRMDSFPGKIRNAGSTVIHIVAPLLHRAVVGTIFSPNYIWDIAGAHAMIRSHGLAMEYLDSRPIDYRNLVHRERAEGVIVAGTRKGIDLIRGSFRLL
jgi:myo-inositol-1(or 4)-monophosphatase